MGEKVIVTFESVYPKYRTDIWIFCHLLKQSIELEVLLVAITKKLLPYEGLLIHNPRENRNDRHGKCSQKNFQSFGPTTLLKPSFRKFGKLSEKFIGKCFCFGGQ